MLRGLACGLWSDDLTHDRDAYLGIAHNISSGKGFCSPETTTPTAYRPPVYPILIGLLNGILPTAGAVAITNIAAGLATVWAVWVLTELWWQPIWWKQFAAALTVAADPLLLRYTAQPMTECLFTVLCAWTLVGITSLCQNPQAPLRWSWGTGMVAGLAALCRPTIFPYLGVIVLCLAVLGLCSRGGTLWQRGTQAALFLTAASVIIGLWAGRNLVVFGKPLLTTTHGGYTLLLGNNPVFFNEVARRPWGTVWEHDSLIRWQASLANDLQREHGSPVDEFTADAWHSRRAWAAIQHDPQGFLWAMWYRVRSFWSLSPRGPEMKNRAANGLVSAWYAALFLLAMMGLATAAVRQHPAVWIGGLLIVTVAALHLLYWTDTRMRAPLHPVLVALAAGVMANHRSQNAKTTAVSGPSS